MPLRPQQSELEKTVNSIDSGNSKITDIFLFWSPGAGKSLAPVILSKLLTNNKKQITVVPRNSLKYQLESDYTTDLYYIDKTCRVAGNNGDPFRGCNSCVTTYQAIGANPDKWIKICQDNNIMLILDEYHHLSGHGEWNNTISVMAKLSFLRVFMTGTITRGDNTKLPLTPYINNDIDFRDTDNIKWIIYSRKQALIDGSILPFETISINGSGKYLDSNNIERSFDKFGDSGDHLRAAFQTDYAYHMIDLSISHWLGFKKNNPWSKILIVSPDIKTAYKYTDYISNKYPSIKSGIATSEDTGECKINIKEFKTNNNNFKHLECLINVGICYEGLNVPEASHILALTLIRSIPWLDQMTGRVVRNYPGKTKGFLFCPSDPRMMKALKSIDGNIIRSANGEAPAPSTPSKNEGTGDYNGGITALSSQAHINTPLLDNPIIKESQSEIEYRLKKEINNIVNKIIGQSSTGNRNVKSRLLWMRIKTIVNNGRDENGKLIKKALNEMTIKELKKVNDFIQIYK